MVLHAEKWKWYFKIKENSIIAYHFQTLDSSTSYDRDGNSLDSPARLGSSETRVRISKQGNVCFLPKVNITTSDFRDQYFFRGVALRVHKSTHCD